MKIQNDPELLELFIHDMEQQADVWKPTNYWKWQCRRMQQQLAATGLDGFRTNWNIMRGVDLGPKQSGLVKREVFTNEVIAWIAKHIPLCSRYDAYVDSIVEQCDTSNLEHIGKQLALMHILLRSGDYSKLICEKVEDSGIGDPYLYEFNGKKYSSNMMFQIALLALMFRARETDQCRSMVEIGGGYGGLAEVFCKYRGGDCEYFVSIDIPPLVYVTTQYLRAAFPGAVIDYREVRDRDSIEAKDVQGRILVIPPWKVPALKLKFDVLWNSASFQEMEADVVDNYLDHFKNCADGVFINTLTQGHRKGLGGQLEQIDFEKLLGHIGTKGFRQRPIPASCPEATLFQAILPRHSAGYFGKK